MDLLNSDSDVQKVDLCHHLPNFEKIFRVGNLLLLKQTTSNLEQGVFYLLDLQNGRLFGKPMTFYELFGKLFRSHAKYKQFEKLILLNR